MPHYRIKRYTNYWEYSEPIEANSPEEAIVLWREAGQEITEQKLAGWLMPQAIVPKETVVK